jgi:hypothetical protein
MKRTARIVILIAFVAAMLVPSVASASCWITYMGVDHLDTDCDFIIDSYDGDVVDNCPGAKNGDCDVDELNCDVDGNSTPTDIELAAGHQIDWDDNGVGDACDDYDMDGIVDYIDNCRSVYNPTQDPEFCDDSDGDRFEDPIDNCPEDYNTEQIDTDEDGVGDVCDNCIHVYNPAQGEMDCPFGDDTAGGGGLPQYSTSPPQPDGGIDTDFGPGRIKGNGVTNSCSLASHPTAISALSIAMMLAALAWVRRRA